MLIDHHVTWTRYKTFQMNHRISTLRRQEKKNQTGFPLNTEVLHLARGCREQTVSQFQPIMISLSKSKTIRGIKLQSVMNSLKIFALAAHDLHIFILMLLMNSCDPASVQPL